MIMSNYMHIALIVHMIDTIQSNTTYLAQSDQLKQFGNDRLRN